MSRKSYHEKLWGGYFSPGTKGRENVPETRRSDAWLFRETLQQEGESMESEPCLRMTQKHRLPWLVADEGRSRGQSFVTSSISVPRVSGWNRAANTDCPAHKSDSHSGFSAAPRSVFWPQWALKQQWQLRVIYYGVSLTSIGLVKWGKARTHQ